MRAAIDIRHLDCERISGIGEYTINLLNELLNNNEYTWTFLSSGSARAKRNINENLKKINSLESAKTVQHKHLTAPNKIINALAFASGEDILSRIGWKTDIIFFPNLNFIGKTNAPYAVVVHDLSFLIYPQFFSRKMQLWHKMVRPKTIIERAAAIIAPSQATKQDLLKFFKIDENCIHVIPHGIDFEKFASSEGQDEQTRSKLKMPKKYIFFLGTIEPRKNIERIISAFELINDPSLNLVIGGGIGWRADGILKRMRDSKLSDKIHYIGYVREKDKPALYRGACAFIFPSIYEGFGIPPLEAMASGVPVITSHTSSLPEVVSDAAIMVDPYNEQDIKTAIEQVLNDPMLCKILSKRGLERAKTFTWKRTAEETLRVLMSIQKK